MNVPVGHGGGARNSPPLSNDEASMWEEAAADLQPPKMLARALEHQKSVISTVTTVGALLAGLGGVTATITFASGSSWSGVPLLTLAVSVLAGSAVLTALVARRPTFAVVNTHNLLEVRDYYQAELRRRRTGLKLSSGLLISAAGLAVLVAFLAGLQTLLVDSPRNSSSLSTSVGAEGAVTVTLGGAVDRLGAGEHVRVEISDGRGEGPMVDQTVHPDATGTATLAAETVASPGPTSVTATVTVLDAEGRPTGTVYTLTATHPPVPDGAASTTG